MYMKINEFWNKFRGIRFMLKKKISQLLAAVMVATTVLGANVQAVGATVVDDTIAVTASKVEKYSGKGY